MSLSKLRRQIAWTAARMMYSREVTEYYAAKQKAAKQICKGWVKPADLPTNSEIRDQVQMLARMHEGSDAKAGLLLKMRLRALWWMKQLDAFHPKLIGSVLQGSIREGSDVDLHVFASTPQSIATNLDQMGVAYDIERKQIVKDGDHRVFTHIHLQDEYPIELTVYHPRLLGHRFRSSITGKAIERCSPADLERRITLEHELSPDELEAQISELDARPDRFSVFLALLLPLENVKQNPVYHPEGEALFHSLQVYGIAKDQMAYDEEFLLAALLHDVGKAIDPHDHVAAGLEALAGFITARTQWLIANHMEAHRLHDRTIGARARKRLTAHPLYDDLCLLSQCDRAGRVPGAEADSVDAALDYIEQLAELFD